ncbi:NAD(P)H-quinone oxidoreductase [Hymenobacter endophyticus]|uniref:NAD(P)H-quinone oxidoreductase n=1 Tax=Hymenobacter endophyticus TaxID=3076335 RepID=A0ABU3TBP0_9BACT|nr:NAD(P)H-quinone oxidoreductase [Hymenobacter endophyticus]MDU0368793.1 NAD(P)H-quinone oxidoreductase [Hymenobacter endophyticus]
MHAIIIRQPGGPEVLELQEVAPPEPAAHEILIRVAAAGINRPDVLLRQGKYQGSGDVAGLIPGLEVAGTVVQCGSSVSRWQPGNQVCALLAQGGYAQYVAVDARHCLPVPPGLTMPEAASLPETAFTVWHNVFQRGQLLPGERLLVHGGSSGIGVLAVQLARALGSPVATTVGSAEKAAALQALGAEPVINYREADFEAVLQASGGVDVILDMVGGEYTAKNLRLLRPDGRLVFINAMQGAAASFNALDLMSRRLTITGSTLRPRSAEFKAALAQAVEQHVWPLLASGAVRPVLHATLPLAQAQQAHQLLESSAHIGKLVLVMD